MPPILNFIPLLIWMIAIPWISIHYKQKKEDADAASDYLIIGTALWLIVAIVLTLK